MDSFKNDSLSLAESYRSQFGSFDTDKAEKKADAAKGNSSGSGVPAWPFIIALVGIYCIGLFIMSWSKDYDNARITRKPGWIFYVISLLLCFASLWALLPIALRLLTSRFYRCPRCGRICLKRKARTLKRPNFLREGTAAVTWSCMHCGTFATEEVVYYRPKKSSFGFGSGSDHGSGSSDSDSWGGGNSDGGGASGSW